MQIKYILLLLPLLLIFSCSTQSESAGFASETTNGESATIILTGDTIYSGAKVCLIPKEFNPTTSTLPSDLTYSVSEKGVVEIMCPDSGTHNLYAVNRATGNKAFLSTISIEEGESLKVAMSAPGNIRVHFKNTNSYIDTTNGYIFFPGYTDYKQLKGNLVKESEGFTVLFDSIPISITDPLFYSVTGNPDYTQSIGTADLESNKTFDLTAKLLYQFITTQHFDIPSNNIETVVSIGKKLWIGTEGGISTIEESNITNQSIAWYEHDEKNKVRTILPTSDGSIYYGTEQGVFKMRTDSKGNIYTATVLEYTGPVNDLAIDSRGALWAATERGVYKTYQGFVKHFTVQRHNLPSDTVNTIVIDSSGTAIGGTNSGLFYLNSDGSTKVVTASMTMALRTDTITTLEVTTDNNTWVGTKGGGITLCTPDYWYNYFYTYEHIYTGAAVTDIDISADGVIWACTDNGYLLHGKNGVWLIFLGHGGIIPGVPINEVTIGNNGNIFCGTEGAGVFVIGPSYNFKTETNRSGNPSGSFPDGALCTKVPAP